MSVFLKHYQENSMGFHWYLYFIVQEKLYSPKDLQEVVAVLVCPDPHGQTHDDGRHTVATGVVEAHLSVVHIPHLCQHPVQVDALNQEPGEHTQPEVVQTNSHQLARELEPKTQMCYMMSNKCWVS